MTISTSTSSDTLIDDLAVVAAHWKRHRDRGYLPRTVRAAMLQLMREIVQAESVPVPKFAVPNLDSTERGQAKAALVDVFWKANHLVDLANACGGVLTITQEPLRPLAMGHYGHRVEVRPRRT